MGKVIEIPSHNLGPVHAVQQVTSELDMDEPVCCKLLRFYMLLGLA